MILMLLLPLAAVAFVCLLPRGSKVGNSQSVAARTRIALRYRFQRIKLSADWWDQFERDFAAYVDPSATRARDRERS
jgi:hypothetical protein